MGEVYTVRVFSGQRWMRVNQITLLAGTADGDGAALFVVEGRGWLPRQSASLTVEECESGDVTELGSWVVDGNGSFRFAHTDPGEGTYALTIQGLESEPVRHPHRADRPARARPTGTGLPSARVTSRRHG